MSHQVTATMLNARVEGIGHRAPKDKAVAQLRADVRSKKMMPVRALLRIAFADIDDGVPVRLVTQFLREMVERIEQYAARRERRVGVLSFTDALKRKQVHGERQECEAHIALLGIADTPESLDEAIAELNEEITADQELVALLTARKAELGAGR